MVRSASRGATNIAIAQLLESGYKMSLEDSVNEVLRKIGRNLMLFQQLEYLLKYIIANGNISGYASQLKDKKIKQDDKIRVKTLGQLVTSYIDTVHSVDAGSPELAEDLDEAHFSFSFKIESDSAYYESRKTILTQILTERNELVHHLLPQFDTSSSQSCIELDNKLEEQSGRIRREIEEVRAVAASLEKGRQELAGFLTSDAGTKQIYASHLQQSRLTLLLADFSVKLGTEDGWVSMSAAGQLLKEHAPNEIALLKKNYGCKTLKSVILATDIFDVMDENTLKRGTRALYRLKEGWTVSLDESDAE
jgi:hypothetical protein